MKSLSQYINENKVDVSSAINEYFSRVKLNKLPNRAGQVKLIARVNKELNSLDHQLEKNYTDSEADALDNYVSINYQKINSELRTGKLSAKNKKIVDTIDLVMEKNILKQDIIVFRAVDPAHIKFNAGFVSTSLSPMTANNFKRGNADIFKLKIPKGTNYAYIGGGEYELLLPRNLDVTKYILN